jgi:ubiquitin carboxyl-terminal hydrolase 2/21
MEAWKRYIRRDDSHLVDLFVGQLKSTLRCTHCNHESVTFEPFWDLSLGIPARTGDVSLNECFDAFTKEETLDGDEMPTCESCKTRRKSTKRYSLYRLPKILVVHLKRFSPTERFRQKLSSTVTFPLTGLSLARYTDSVTSSSYNCYAISNHSGTLYSGHYTAYAKHPHTGHWQLFNDSKVSKCSSSNVISNEAYLLFFELS